MTACDKVYQSQFRGICDADWASDPDDRESNLVSVCSLVQIFCLGIQTSNIQSLGLTLKLNTRLLQI